MKLFVPVMNETPSTLASDPRTNFNAFVGSKNKYPDSNSNVYFNQYDDVKKRKIILKDRFKEINEEVSHIEHEFIKNDPRLKTDDKLTSVQVRVDHNQKMLRNKTPDLSTA
eukprot:CAMPEP_0116873416 /NCGR_PEP_ID=MMETSP0463-20121206/4519_1 /TAXON_ID=181622 /ORGANISM="Strombidinopsis sp, Strain SopsisLIS2011" /LENGTH=110 /DNA_ID=CAMNT_0004515321 /DNA_START=309 /DNA_END=641 /DNA_ORIENTATION=-